MQSVSVHIPSKPFATFIARLPCFGFPNNTARPQNVRILPVHMPSGLGKTMMHSVPQLVASDGFDMYVCMYVCTIMRGRFL